MYQKTDLDPTMQEVESIYNNIPKTTKLRLLYSHEDVIPKRDDIYRQNDNLIFYF